MRWSSKHSNVGDKCVWKQCHFKANCGKCENKQSGKRMLHQFKEGMDYVKLPRAIVEERES